MENTIKEKGEVRKGLRAIRRHLRPFKNELILLTFLGLVSALANGSVPYVTGRFFDALIEVSKGVADQNIDSLPLWTSLLLIWVVIQLVANNILVHGSVAPSPRHHTSLQNSNRWF